MRDTLECNRCGFQWESGRNQETLCPLCRTPLNKKASPRNVQGDKPIFVDPLTKKVK